MDTTSPIPACSEMDSKDALDLSDSVSDFQFLAVSGLNWKDQIAWVTVTPEGDVWLGFF